MTDPASPGAPAAAAQTADTAAPMQAVVTPVTAFEQNCTLLWCTRTGKGAFIDAGGDVDRLLGVAGKYGVTLEKLLVTHGHLDHCGATGEIAERFGIPIEGPHIDDKFWIDQLGTQGAQFGLPAARAFTPDRWLVDGDTVTVGDLTLNVRHCPGHTPGHVVFQHAGLHLAFVGDVLFAGSIGRTDFPRGDHGTLIQSIVTRLWPMGDDTRFVPGHGPMSSFGEERRSNPFVADRVLARG